VPVRFLPFRIPIVQVPIPENISYPKSATAELLDYKRAKLLSYCILFNAHCFFFPLPETFPLQLYNHQY